MELAGYRLVRSPNLDRSHSNWRRKKIEKKIIETFVLVRMPILDLVSADEIVSTTDS